jgi:trimeric autotransporter adhesin
VQQSAAGQNLTVGANTDGAAVNFAGTAGARKLTGVADGDVSSTSTDAVTGKQLNATNEQVAQNTSDIGTLNTSVTNLDGRVTTTEGSITNLQTQISSGTVGLVQQSAAGEHLTVGANTDGTEVNFAGTAGERKLTGVAEGELSETSTDAVNGSQLNATNMHLAATDKQVAQNTSDIDTLNTSVTNIDGRVTTAEGSITNLQTQISNGALGMVQQSAAGQNLTVGKDTDGAAVDFTGTNGTRKLTGVANGTNDSDALTVAQMKAMGLYDPVNDRILGALVYDDNTMATATLGGTNGTTLNNLAPGLIAAGSMQAVNGGQLFDLQANFQSQFDQLSSNYGNLDGRVGAIEQGLADGSIGDGGGITDPSLPGTGEGSVAVGDGADASGTGSTAVGTGSNASGENSTAIGSGAIASGDNSTANGAGAVASGNGSTATGAGAVASGNGSTANGNNASATGSNSTALGSNSSATGNNSVALGAGSVADRDNSVSVGSAGNERQITNVAAGTARTDAANWGQVQDAVNGVQNWADQKFTQLNKRVNAMGAMGAAGTQMAINAAGVTPGNGRIAVGVGAQGSQAALSVGYAKAINERARFSLGVTASGSDTNVGVGFGVDL